MNFTESQKEILKFRENRNWKQFHKIKDLLIGLNIEVSELSELFLWKTDTEIEKVNKSRIEEELADIYIFLTYICNHFEIDLLNAVDSKIKLNNIKYPVEKSYNSNKKYSELE